jgi:hypothetical protein
MWGRMARENLFSESQIDRTIYYGNLLLKTLLVAVMVCLTGSTLLSLSYGGLNEFPRREWYSLFIWYSLSSSMWVLFCSTIYLLLVAIYGQFSSGKKLNSLTEQFILLLIAIFVAGVAMVTAFQFNNL